jgi:hypothetical protein
MSPVPSETGNELHDLHPEGLSKLFQVEHGDVALTALDGPDEGPVQPGPLTEFGLGQLQFRPPVTDAVADGNEECAIFEIHAGRQWCRLA